MPRYFFDWSINGATTEDRHGRELDDRAAARKLAIDEMYCRVRERDPSEYLRIECTVRDEDGAHVYHHATIVPAFTEEMRQALEERQARRDAARAARLAAQAVAE
ncbi:hypothetical protein EJV46_16040 [Roseococcus sp. SYP-B2431]|uniref:DUF6894 family protein n=1 Tax=Roseococcus sp. SYP-B2431 TaxID=2496640 RepID=UPI00103D0779|nr:hypothetical protein [Roseococcus sp. SYP-B2431]TCH97628.1 hypothetical protein EJV46_16040 [Roseococcus sp. SYP-B2431]